MIAVIQGVSSTLLLSPLHCHASSSRDVTRYVPRDVTRDSCVTSRVTPLVIEQTATTGRSKASAPCRLRMHGMCISSQWCDCACHWKQAA